MQGRPQLLELLERFLPLPTAPFHESFIRAFLCEELAREGLQHRVDEFGNIIAGNTRMACPVACVAHMDHPGFEIAKVDGDRAEADWFGGVAADYFIGARVVIYGQATGAVRARGAVGEITRNPEGRVEKLRLKIEGSAEPGDFGTWDLIAFRRRGERIYTKGADDLVGCAVILVALKELKARGLDGQLSALFTRAEEQGFVGTLAMMQRGSLPLSTKVISIETSKALPGVVLGGGPVIRLGDRTSMFRHEMILFMDYVAAELKKKEAAFVFQRRVMDGGTCEAAPYTLGGYMAGGIAVPLHNYHNQGKRRIGAEGVHLRDVEGAAKLLVEMTTRIDEFPGPAKRVLERFESTWKKYGPRLCRWPAGAASRDQGVER